MDSHVTSEEYNSYYKSYIDLVSENPLLDTLKQGMDQTIAFFKSIPEEKHEFRYATGKWTPKEILLHLIDTERVFAYRALQFARSENAVLPGFDQDEFMSNSVANIRPMDSLLLEYEVVRRASLALFANCDEEVLMRRGEASNSILSVRAAGYIISGHEIHHRSVITERYLA